MHRAQPLLGLAALLGLVACAPVRKALPTAFPLVQGANPVPARGVGASLEIGDGVRGLELGRTELVNVGIIAGIHDLVGLSLHGYGDLRNNGWRGGLIQGKVRLAHLGPRTAVGLHAAAGFSQRADRSAQNDTLRTADLALPVEWVVGTRPGGKRFTTVYLGPRLTYENYRDALNDSTHVPQHLRHAFPGVVAGVQVAEGGFNVFGELSLVYLSQNVYNRVTYGGVPFATPQIGIAFHFGGPHRWPAREKQESSRR